MPQFLAVFLVLALLLAALWLLRRHNSVSPGLVGQSLVSVSQRLSRTSGKRRQMQVVERVPLTAQHSLHLIALGDRLIMVGVSPGGCSQVAILPATPIGRDSPE
jgi:flagellar biogenesis protein FliO